MLKIVMILLLSLSSHAKSIKVAFVTTQKTNGQIVQFEDGGHFSHIAISYQGLWLHADPREGVTLSENLNDLGTHYTFLSHPQLQEPSPEFVHSVLGMKFNMFAHWQDASATYCSKFIGKYFSLIPAPMTFASPDWQGIKDLPIGQLGMSPDDIFRQLLNRGFIPAQSQSQSHCDQLLK